MKIQEAKFAYELLRFPKLKRATIVKKRDKKLKDLVSYARNNSKFYSELYKNVGEDFKLTDLKPITKKDLVENMDDILTDKSVTEKDILDHISSLSNALKKINGKYYVAQTSGTTGKSAAIVLDEDYVNSFKYIAALRMVLPNKEKGKLNIPKPDKIVMVTLKNSFVVSYICYEEMSKMGASQFGDCTVMDMKLDIKEFVKELNKIQPDIISTFPSHALLLCDMQESGELNIDPRVVAFGGEKLTQKMRERIENVFNCKCVETYACTEGGLVAEECSEHHLHINEDTIIVEAVDNDYNPVPDGSLSDKILITNLDNKIMPIIRYEVTDKVTIHSEKCKCGMNTRWVEVYGRSTKLIEVTNKDGKKIKFQPYILDDVDNINRYQCVIHEDEVNKIEIRIDTNENREEKFNQLIKEITARLNRAGWDNFEFYLSDEKTKTEKSGKYNLVYKEEKKQECLK